MFICYLKKKVFLRGGKTLNNSLVLLLLVTVVSLPNPCAYYLSVALNNYYFVVSNKRKYKFLLYCLNVHVSNQMRSFNQGSVSY